MTLFLTLPPEIRLIIYDYLLTDDQIGRKNKKFWVSTENYKKEEHGPLSHSTYRIIADRFRARSTESTYRVRSRPNIHPSILGVSRQIHAEAAPILYSQHTFDFGSDIESMVPFFRDRTPTSLASIKSIAMTKSSPAYLKDFDRCEWRSMCQFVSENMQLHELHLHFVCGRPIETLLDNLIIEHYSKTDIAFMTTKNKTDGAEWIAELASITNLRKFVLTARFVVSPYPTSQAMHFWINLSASVETGLTEYLTERMVKTGHRTSYCDRPLRSIADSVGKNPAPLTVRPSGNEIA